MSYSLYHHTQKSYITKEKIAIVRKRIEYSNQSIKMNSTKATFFLVLFLVAAVCITMTESKCQGNIDCREEPHKQPCPVPLACLFGSCVCPWKSHSTFSPCQIKCAHSGKKVVDLYDSDHCVCGDK
ncbi:unnamed protein product [Brassica oleracea var. botrytis]|uniref:Uncharacterized protein n=1 Tax=Brassica oleracea var. oleracea TaxID=109376 RepID=A0A0D3D9N1_BRAOL